MQAGLFAFALAIPPTKARSAVRKLKRDWGLLEWGQTRDRRRIDYATDLCRD
jgi:hypothetical protein